MIITTDWICAMGHLRYGHYELELTDPKQIAEFKAMPESEQKLYIEDNANFIIDDYELDDVEDIGDIYITE